MSCSLGVLFFYNQEVRNFYLWVPQDSDIWAKFETIQQQYGISPQMTLLLTMNNESDSILSPKNMDIAYNIFNEINNIKSDQLNYSDLCLRSYPASPHCTSDDSNIFGFFFNSNELLWQNDTTIYATINDVGSHSAIYGFAGGIKVKVDSSMEFVYSANVLLFIYELRGSISKTEHDIIYKYMGEFQNYWSVHQNDYDEINIEYATQRSLDDEVSRVITGDFHIMVLAVTVMTIYLMITLAPFSCIAFKPWLAVSAVLVLICSMIIGFGISFICGSTFNIICILVAYILLGVGVDDMIILVDTYERMKEFKCNNELRLAKTLSECGLSISLTSLCSSMAFAIGSTTDLPAISHFCTFAACSFLGNYILQFLIFVPLMVYENERISKGNNFCCPCCIHHTNVQTVQTVQTIPTTKIMKIMKICVIPVLSNRFCRCIIIFIFCCILCGSMFVSFDGINTQSDDTKLVPDDSFMLDYIAAYKTNFGHTLITDLNIIIKNQDFSDFNIRNNTYNFINALQNHPNAIGKVHHWLDAFANFTHNSNLNDSNLFYQYLHSFCNDVYYIPWHSEICYNDFHDDNIITSTRFFLTASKNSNRGKQWDEYLHWNSICKSYFSSNNCFIFEPEYTFAYLVSSIQIITIQNMIFTALGVCGILCLFLDFRIALFCLLMVIIIDIHLFGWMWLFNISLDVVSYTELVMAAGLTVDYVIHIVHAITESNNNNNNNMNIAYEEKIKLVMSEMGSSVVKGAFTTFLGAIALVFSHSKAFRIFLFMFLGIIIIALAHSILLVPALLGEFKFIYKGISHSNTGTSTSSISFSSITELTTINRKERINILPIDEEQELDEGLDNNQQTNHAGFGSDLVH